MSDSSADWTRLRHEYEAAGLRTDSVDPDPLVQFAEWLDAAQAAGLPEPHAMTLATATPDGRPAARMVLLRGFDARGFVFYTNYASRKAAALTANSRAALVFYWPELHRQVRVEGTVARVDAAELDAYFAGRPRGSQIGAWASAQSAPIADRAALERAVAAVEQAYADQPVPRPPFWGGFRVTPECLEFWQGQPSRLHDRIRYDRSGAGGWTIQRLQP